MSYCRLEWYSQALGRPVATNLILPEAGEPPFPVLYLLHGLGGGAEDWLRNSRLEWYLRGLPLVVAMPDGERSFYARAEEGPDFHQHIAFELPQHLERQLAVRSDRAGRAIAGLSMGGYGAMRLAFAHPDRYCAAASFSGALTIGTWPDRVVQLDQVELRRLFGVEPQGGPHDILQLASNAAAASLLPAIWIDCGLEDPIPLEHSRVLRDRLRELGVPFTYEELPGRHDWDYWDARIRQALPWVLSQVQPAPQG